MTHEESPLAIARLEPAVQRMTLAERDAAEKTIRTTMIASSLIIGLTLREINVRYGWALSHRSFSAYLRDRYPGARSRAYQLIEYAERVAPALPPGLAYDDPRIPPEKHVRALTGLTFAQIVERIRTAIETDHPLALPAGDLPETPAGVVHPGRQVEGEQKGGSTAAKAAPQEYLRVWVAEQLPADGADVRVEVIEAYVQRHPESPPDRNGFEDWCVAFTLGRRSAGRRKR